MSAMLPSFVSILGWALIDFLWQGALVGMAAAIALMLLRNARPQTRYAVSCAALALCLALPMAGVWRGMQADASATDRIHVGAASVGAISGRDRAEDGPSTISGIISLKLGTAASWQSTLQGQLPWIVALWSIGAGLLAARMAIGMAWVQRVGRSRSGATDMHWQERLDHLATAFGMQRAIRLRVVAELDSPVAAGWWRPLVLVPTALIAHMPSDLLEALLAHELAHIKRHDYLVNLVQSAIEALLFYHPIVWWLSWQIRIEREQIADDLAAKALGEPRRLALALHELDTFQQGRMGIGCFSNTQLVPAANGGKLMSRIQRLIRPNQHALSWRMALPIVGLTVVCLTGYAHGNAPALATVPGNSAMMGSVTAPVVAPAPAMLATTALANTYPGAAPMAVLAPAHAAVGVVPVIGPSGIIYPRHTAISGLALARATAALRPLLASTNRLAIASATAAAVLANGTSRIITNASSHSREDAYAVVRAGRDGISMSGDTRDIPNIERTRQKVHGDFVWVRRGQKTFVVQDPALLAKVTELWQPAETLGAKMEAFSKKMEIPSQQMEALGKQMEALSEQGNPQSAAMEKTSAQMEALGRQQEAIGIKMETLARKMEQAKTGQREGLDSQMEALQAQMTPLEAQMEKLSAVMELHSKDMERARQPMEKLSRQMEEASKPMEALGKQLEALGKQEEQLSNAADQAVKVLIDEALRNGKGVPAESAAPQ